MTEHEERSHKDGLPAGGPSRSRAGEQAASPRKKIHVVGGVFERAGRILAAQRGPESSMAGYWEFPGGKVEPGETPQQALARELREELRVEAQVGEFVARGVFDYSFGTVVLDAYACALEDGAEPELTEHAEVRWLTVDELVAVEWAPADVPIVEEIRRRKQGSPRGRD